MKRTLPLIAGTILLNVSLGLAQSGGLDGDLQTSNLYRGTEYPLTPTSQVRPITPSVDMTNLGVTTLQNCTAHFFIQDAGLQQVGASLNGAGSLEQGETGTAAWTYIPFTFTPPEIVEDYQITAVGFNDSPPWAPAPVSDPNSSNDSVVDFFSVTESVFARETGDLGIGVSLGGVGQPKKYCNKFELVNDDHVQSVTAYFYGHELSDVASAEVFADDKGYPGTAVAASADWQFTATSDDYYNYPMEAGPVFLTAGTYYACVTADNSTAIALGRSNIDHYTPQSTLLSSDGVSWDYLEDNGPGTSMIPMVRMNLGDCQADAGTLTADATPVCLYNGSADIGATEGTSPNVPVDYEVLYVLTQGAGMEVIDASSTPEFTVVEAGEFTVHTLVYDPNTVDFSALPPGSTTNDVNAMLIQGGGTACGAMDMSGTSITVEACIVGLEDRSDSKDLVVYPNPSQGEFMIELKGLEAEEAHIVIMDMAGRQVYTESIVLNGDTRRAMNLDVTKGSYLIQVITNEGVASSRLQVN